MNDQVAEIVSEFVLPSLPDPTVALAMKEFAENAAAENLPEGAQEKFERMRAIAELPIRSATPSVPMSHENAMHRTIVLLSAAGYSQKNIIAQLGVNPSTVSQTLRQPWAQSMLAKLIFDATEEKLQKRFAKEIPEALQTYVDIFSRSSTRPADRISAANSFLDRFLGKPTQRVETKSEVTYKDAASTVSSLEQELHEVNERLRVKTRRTVDEFAPQASRLN